jgi:membrane protein
MMAALRLALRLAWDEDSPRPFLRGKAVDILLVIGVSLVGLLSVGLTVAARTVGNLTEDLGPVSVVSPWVEWTFAVAIPLVLSFLTVLFLYRVVPPAEVRLRDSWVPALFVATAFVLIQNLYAVYLQHFGNYNAIYGSLAAIVAFLFFIYVVSNVFLLGAELASEWPRTRLLLERGEVESEEGGREPLTKQAIGIIKGLVVRTDREETPEEGEKSEPEKTSPRRAG